MNLSINGLIIKLNCLVVYCMQKYVNNEYRIQCSIYTTDMIWKLLQVCINGFLLINILTCLDKIKAWILFIIFVINYFSRIVHNYVTEENGSLYFISKKSMS